MAKTANAKPLEESGVSRKVDFNLKKDDLMLLIMEGRKEMMEEKLATLQENVRITANEFDKAVNAFRMKFRKWPATCLSTSTVDFIKTLMGVKELSDEELGRILRIELREGYGEKIDYTRSAAQSLDGTKSASTTYIKQSMGSSIMLPSYESLTITADINLFNRDFTKNSKFFKGNTKLSESYTNRINITLVEKAPLNKEAQREMKEYKDAKKLAKKHIDAVILHSEILTEYIIFNSNKPRAKAQMIKEILAVDDAGKSLLGNIMNASKGVKLLSD